LYGLGKDKAVSALQEFLDIAGDHMFAERDPENIDTSDRQCVILILRLLFEPADRGERMPKFQMGLMNPCVSDGERDDWPHFPLAIQDDIPFFVLHSYLLHGLRPRPEDLLAWAKKYGKLRSDLLRPCDNPLLAGERLASDPRTRRLFRTSGLDPLAMLRTQALHMVLPLLPPELGAEIRTGLRLSRVEKVWTECRRFVDQADIYWDEGEQKYFRRK
jgi:hypothetical protein